jgi:sporulation protein YlmC with PRC-barrel domain
MESRANMIAKKAGLFVLSCLVVCAPGGYAAAQVAGSTTFGVAFVDLDAVALGWSAKKQILGQTVFNENNEMVGTIDDIIIAPDKAVSYAIVGAGGFAGVGKHDVAIPVNLFKEEGGKFVLAGATAAAIKALPRFEYAK